MWRRWICFVLLVAIVFTQSSKLIVYLNFKINQEYIAKELCENREIPKMNCNGKCYLAKKLQEQEQEEKENAPVEQRIKLDVLFCTEWIESSALLKKEFTEKNIFSNTRTNLLKGCINKILHPPQLV